MTEPQPEIGEADRWLREADEELRAAQIIAQHPEVPDRVAGFHAHLAAEKALKSLLICRGVSLPRIHDLVGLRALLPAADQPFFSDDDVELLNPWTIEGRYPADIADAGTEELAKVLAAARRVVKAAAGAEGTGEGP